ncbi:hypothetical protein Tco_0288205 [Tanacetum coccineum]
MRTSIVSRSFLNKHRKQVLFEEGKFHPRADGPFRILKKINDNAYKVELPGHYGVSDTFNVADLSSYTPNANFDDDSGSSRFLEGEDDTDWASKSSLFLITGVNGDLEITGETIEEITGEIPGSGAKN